MFDLLRRFRPLVEDVERPTAKRSAGVMNPDRGLEDAPQGSDQLTREEEREVLWIAAIAIMATILIVMVAWLGSNSV